MTKRVWLFHFKKWDEYEIVVKDDKTWTHRNLQGYVFHEFDEPLNEEAMAICPAIKDVITFIEGRFPFCSSLFQNSNLEIKEIDPDEIEIEVLAIELMKK